MPVWHETLKPLAESGRVALVGVIQEQHPDRCRLFSQWRGMEWPILHDPINVLAPTAVPVFVAIDEHGVVRGVGPKLEWVTDTFLKTDYPPPETAAPIATRPGIEEVRRLAMDDPSQSHWQMLGDALILWGGPSRIDDAIAAYDRAATLDARSAPLQFRLGVAYRMRSESDAAQPGDFQRAVERWGAALEIDPNHYIYRRRIQQYGPRLIKPYPFYDWVAEARADIESRGETPIALAVEPGGAEIAQPERLFEAAETRLENPDPEGRINRDERGLISISAVVVPASIAPGEAARIHLELEPTRLAHWNNEAEPLQIWVDAPEGWKIEGNLFSAAQPAEPESSEARRVEFEVLSPDTVGEEPRISGYALYYVCEETGGQCLYLRQDFVVTVGIRDD